MVKYNKKVRELMDQKIYFTADLHFGHKNILTLANRKFNSIEEHDEHLINAINSTVTAADHLYILGDLGFHRDYIGLVTYVSQINCKNIHVIKGNHDNMQNLVRLRHDGLIVEVKEMKDVQKGRHHIFCCHYPMREWPGFYRGHYHAYGHVHNTLSPYEKSIDVGVDSIGFKPIEFDDVIDRIEQRGKVNTRISSEDERINEFFPDLNTHYFVWLCTGNKEIRDKIYNVLRKK